MIGGRLGLQSVIHENDLNDPNHLNGSFFSHELTRMCTNKKILYRDLSYKIIGLAMVVHRKLGYGFLEKVYENSLMILFRRDRIPEGQQAPIDVRFEGEIVGNYVADVLVGGKIILELECVETITNVHRTQALNYLKATGRQLAIIINFAKVRLEFERLAF